MFADGKEIDPFVKRLTAMAEPLLESAKQDSLIWIWINHCSIGEKNKIFEFMKEFNAFLSRVKVVSMGSKQIVGPRPSNEFYHALHCSQVNPIYLQSLLSEPRFSEVRRYLSKNIEFIEALIQEYHKADPTELMAKKAEGVYSSFQSLLMLKLLTSSRQTSQQRPRRHRSKAVLDVSNSACVSGKVRKSSPLAPKI